MLFRSGDDVGITGEGGVDHLTPVNARKAQVGHDHVEGETVERFEGGWAVRCLNDLKAFVAKSFSHNTSQCFLIVYQKEMWHELSKY